MPAKTHKRNFLKKHGLPEDTSLSIEDISALSGVPSDALQQVYNRGVGAWIGFQVWVLAEVLFEADTFYVGFPRTDATIIHLL